MNLTSEERNRLLNFIGYGSLDAPVWFLGMEEGTGGKNSEAELENNLRIRAQYFKQIEDLVEAHDEYFGYDIRLQRTFPHQIWPWMGKLMRGLSGQVDWEDMEKAKDYVRRYLGRRDGETFLTELLPLPAKGLKHWPYPLTTLFATRPDYEHALLEKRKQNLRDLVQEHQPDYLFSYGFMYRKDYKSLFTGCEWSRLDTTGKIYMSKINNTRMIITPFFGGRRGLSHDDAAVVIHALRMPKI